MQSWAGIYFVDNHQVRFLYIFSGPENCPVSLGCLGEEWESKNRRAFPGASHLWEHWSQRTASSGYFNNPSKESPSFMKE